MCGTYPKRGSEARGRFEEAGSFCTRKSGQVRRSRRGITLVWTALVLMVLLGIVGLTLDVGYGFFVGNKLQQAADAASLAGAQKLGEELEVIQQAAQELGLANYAAAIEVQLALNPDNAEDGDIVIGFFDRDTGIFTPTLISPNAVKVVARRNARSQDGPVSLVFAPIFGIDTINVERAAIAMLGGKTGSGLLVLDENEDRTFRLNGDVTLEVRDQTTPDGMGTIHVNSYHTNALKSDGNPTLLAHGLDVHAEHSSDPPDFEGNLRHKQPIIEDPLAGLAPPTQRTPVYTLDTITKDAHKLQPGYYPNGIDITGGTVTLEPGVYVIDGTGLKITGGDIRGEGVMLYVIDSFGKSASEISLTGNGIIDLKPAPLDEGDYGGILLWQDVNNTNDVTIRGTENFSGLDGTVYIPGAHLDVAGTSDSFSFAQLIVNTIQVGGTGTVFIDYDGRYPAPGRRVFLVR